MSQVSSRRQVPRSTPTLADLTTAHARLRAW